MKEQPALICRLTLLLGGTQHICWGLILMILAIVQLRLTNRDLDEIWDPKNRYPPQPGRYSLYGYYPVAAVVFSSLLIIVTGLIALVARGSQSELLHVALVGGFKALNILMAVVFGPLVTGIGFTWVHLLSLDEALGQTGIAIAIFGGLEMVGSIIIACVICCYPARPYWFYRDLRPLPPRMEIPPEDPELDCPTPSWVYKI